MTYKSVEEYNNYLVDNQIQITIINYVKEVNKISYNIDISFIDEFIELVNKNECCIHHSMLQKYGVISSKSETTSDIKKLLNQYEMEEHHDFTTGQVSRRNNGRGSNICNEYFLHPRAFKLCLMRSLKTKQYARYYLLLEECIKYYNDYQINLQQKYIIKLKDKNKEKRKIISNLEEKVDTLLKENKEILINNKEIIKRNKKMELQLNEALERLEITNDKLDDTNEELEESNEKLDNQEKVLNTVIKKLDIATDERIPKPKKLALLEYFVIMKNPKMEYKYYIIRGQKRYITKKKNELDGYQEIKTLECVPNANILWNLIKQKLKDADFLGNKLNLVNMSENDFIKLVEDTYNERKSINL